MIKAIIIDDEPKSIKILSTMLREYCSCITVLGIAQRAQEAIPMIQQLEPDLVFLDIEMPLGNGFDILDQLRPVNFEVIFVTAFDEYSLKAFRYSVLDYLIKPVGIEELQQAVQKAMRNIQLKNFNSRLDNFLQNLKKPSLRLQKIALPVREGIVLVPIPDIIRCEARREYTSFVIKNREKIISSKNIKENEELLPGDTFFRVHNSHLINLNYVRVYHRGRGGHVEMEDGTMIEVATRRKEELLSRLGLVRT
ncbi:MAG TPA: LytTR family DNA-binding domain-containing protein [Chitinophagaceae bacterium]|jgi:two-component system LytT family response regulator